MSDESDIARLNKRVNSSREFTIRDRIALKELILERDNFRNDAISYLGTVVEADEDVAYLRWKLENALWIVNRFHPMHSDKHIGEVHSRFVEEMRMIGIEPTGD